MHLTRSTAHWAILNLFNLLHEKREHQLQLKGYAKESRITQTQRKQLGTEYREEVTKRPIFFTKKKGYMKNSSILIEPSTPYEKQVDTTPNAKHSSIQTVVSIDSNCNEPITRKTARYRG